MSGAESFLFLFLLFLCFRFHRYTSKHGSFVSKSITRREFRENDVELIINGNRGRKETKRNRNTMKRTSSFQVLQAAAAAAAAADGMAFDRPKDGNDLYAELLPSVKILKSEVVDDSTKDNINNNGCITAAICDNNVFAPPQNMGITESSSTTSTTDNNYNSIYNIQQRQQHKNGNEMIELQPIKVLKSDEEPTKGNNICSPPQQYDNIEYDSRSRILIPERDSSSSSPSNSVYSNNIYVNPKTSEFSTPNKNR